MWPMFFFGFLMMFIVTQIYGLLKNRLAIAGIIASYFTLALITYSGLIAHKGSKRHSINLFQFNKFKNTKENYKKMV